MQEYCIKSKELSRDISRRGNPVLGSPDREWGSGAVTTNRI